ncbi:hypothetical protein HWC69_gp100 [Gordonia phage Ranch]|uniref:Uncharacterized protein n=1 Tax=Gordonia phage Ranch TaxID=2599848 RepID=A0A5J6TQZ9_9CAUD|nr:hypothetical protein HWC69_gp100 [Gordonia phage Ranch]QFG12407.1 hypothetical protein PBI_RANCH_100 [Gordonia phage Ranch]
MAEPKNGYVIREEGPRAICRHCDEPIYHYDRQYASADGTGWAHSRTFMVGCQPFNRPRSAQVESGQT